MNCETLYRARTNLFASHRIASRDKMFQMNRQLCVCVCLYRQNAYVSQGFFHVERILESERATKHFIRKSKWSGGPNWSGENDNLIRTFLLTTIIMAKF